MRLPNAENAIITEAKLRAYLLNPNHPDNAGKARVFQALGYSRDEWQLLASDLREQHLPQDATESRPNREGRTYTIIARLTGPAGSATIKSVWQIDFGTEVPRFITAYPA
jgi:hypothetical protein